MNHEKIAENCKFIGNLYQTPIALVPTGEKKYNRPLFNLQIGNDAIEGITSDVANVVIQVVSRIYKHQHSLEIVPLPHTDE